MLKPQLFEVTENRVKDLVRLTLNCSLNEKKTRRSVLSAIREEEGGKAQQQESQKNMACQGALGGSVG